MKIQVLTIYHLALIKTRTKINRYLFYSIYLYICININTLYKQVYIYFMRVYISEAVRTASGEMVHSVLVSVNKNSYSLFKSSEEKLYEQAQQFSDL